MEDCLRAWEGRDWKVRWGGDEPASPDEALPTEGGRAPSPPPSSVLLPEAHVVGAALPDPEEVGDEEGGSELDQIEHPGFPGGAGSVPAGREAVPQHGRPD